jgi:DNA replication and repair protein RecF
VHIESLKLVSFRNYEEREIAFSECGNLIFGVNGSGKTNIIEAIRYLTFGKSFRTNADFSMVKKGADEAYIQGFFLKDSGEIKIESRISKSKKLLKINNIERQKRSELLGEIGCILFSPEDKNIIVGEPEKRRNYIDGEIFDRDALHYKELLRYRKCLKSRNIFLKEKRGKDEIESWDEFLVESGYNIMKKRCDKIEKIKREAEKIYKEFTEEELEINYKNDIEISREKIRETLAENFARDFERGQTERGPHKDNMEIKIDEKDAKEYSSQGQKKMAALALKLAGKKIYEDERGEKPIILLDDVFSELDKTKRKKIKEIIDGNQYIITATEKAIEAEQKIKT